jgi:hypothetical protein
MTSRPRRSQPAPSPQRGTRPARDVIELCGFKAGLSEPLFLRAGRRGLGGRGAPGAGSGARPADEPGWG